jgi:threonine/homoserine/homoserine lactone efflux protein
MMKNWKMTKKDEVNFYFVMMMSLFTIMIVTSLGLVFKVIMLIGALCNLYMLCKTSKELKEEEAQKKAEEDAKEVVVEEITEE